jgi:hypothetical protein
MERAITPAAYFLRFSVKQTGMILMTRLSGEPIRRLPPRYRLLAVLARGGFAMRENTPEAFVNELLVKNSIPLEEIIACARERGAELDRMERIFDLETAEDARLLMALPALLVPADAERVIDYFRKEESGRPLPESAAPEDGRYTLLLLSAFVYNPAFFAMAWNWCAYIRDRSRKAAPKLRPVKDTNDFRVIEFTPARHIEYKAAAGLGFHTFGETTDLPGIGTLAQLGGEMGGVFYLQFRLTITSDLVPRPFAMEIDFTTLKNGKRRRVRLEDNRDNFEITVIHSIPVEADYTHGITIHRIAPLPTDG